MKTEEEIWFKYMSDSKFSQEIDLEVETILKDKDLLTRIARQLALFECILVMGHNKKYIHFGIEDTHKLLQEFKELNIKDNIENKDW